MYYITSKKQDNGTIIVTVRRSQNEPILYQHTYGPTWTEESAARDVSLDLDEIYN